MKNKKPVALSDRPFIFLMYGLITDRETGYYFGSSFLPVFLFTFTLFSL
jgi:hypothetical protein